MDDGRQQCGHDCCWQWHSLPDFAWRTCWTTAPAGQEAVLHQAVPRHGLGRCSCKHEAGKVGTSICTAQTFMMLIICLQTDHASPLCCNNPRCRLAVHLPRFTHRLGRYGRREQVRHAASDHRSGQSLGACKCARRSHRCKGSIPGLSDNWLVVEPRIRDADTFPTRIQTHLPSIRLFALHAAGGFCPS